MKLRIVLAAALLVSIVSCKKDDKKSSCDKTMAGIAGTYHVVKLEAGTAGTYTDFTSSLEACTIDDKVVLNENGTTNYQDLGTICDPNGSDTGTWSIDGSGKLTISGSSNLDVTAADIVSYDCTTLVLTTSEAGIQYRLTIAK